MPVGIFTHLSQAVPEGTKRWPGSETGCQVILSGCTGQPTTRRKPFTKNPEDAVPADHAALQERHVAAARERLSQLLAGGHSPG